MSEKSIPFSHTAEQLQASPMFAVLAQVQALEKAGEHIIHFEIGDPDFNTPPHIVEAGIASLKRGETHYVNSLGISELRDAVAMATERDLGFRPSREQVVIAPAISFVYFVVNCLVNPGEEVIVADPDYASYFSAFSALGVKAVAVPTHEKNQFRIQAEDIEKHITPKTRLMIINSPQNPTGAVISHEDSKKIFDIAKKYDIFIISDEVYGKIVYDEKAHSLGAYDQCRERIIILNSFSKTYAMTGWRLGYAIAPERIVEKIGLMIQTVISSVPAFVQHGGVAALLGDQSCIDNMVDEYRQRRDIIVAGLNDLPGVSCVSPGGAFYAFPNISGTGMSSEEFTRCMLDKARVAVLPGVNFGPMGEGHIRISFATSIENIKEGLARMKEALTQLNHHE
ncbi:MAG: pyridoxal phosphate-dependent aminotransferase [Candidatus Ryanbacteria bacterium]|nr:pyridoxal phosphate-dependent aminotransferase [Candidatus Ryanbacteria bacterium]